MKTTPVKGCLDYLPKEMELRQQVIENILKTYKNNGFLQVKTPILESLENLTNGDSGDNAKLMFKTIKRGAKLNLNKENLTEKDIVEEGLRYDLTVPLARLYTNNKDNLPYPFKSIQIDDSFRAERPQEGRNRQLTQCDIDIWGDPTILGEIEIITTTMEAYYNVGLPNIVCKVNSRKILTSLILNSGFTTDQINDVCIVIDKLDKIGIDGCKKELIELNYNNDCISKLIDSLVIIQKDGIDSLNKFGVPEEEVENMKQLINTVTPFMPKGYSIVFDISIVRGQGYYTGTVFEMYCNASGYKFAVGGGGRYDKMYGKFSGREDIPAVGYGLGLDRVLMVLNKLEASLNESKKLALIYYKDTEIEKIMEVKNNLKNNYDVSVFPQPKNFKEFLRRIKLNGFEYLTKVDRQDVEKI